MANLSLPLLLKRWGHFHLYRHPMDGTIRGLFCGREVRVSSKFGPISDRVLLEETMARLARCSFTFDGKELFIEEEIPKFVGGLKGGGSGSSKSSPSKVSSPPSNSSQRTAVENVASTHLGPIQAPLDNVFPAVFSIPQRDPNFVGRERLIAHVGKEIKTPTQVVLCGIGGLGKSAALVEILHRNITLFNLVWVIDGENPLKGFYELGRALGLVRPGDKADAVLHLVHEYLKQKPGWCLAFDNVEKEKISHFLPEDGYGVLIMTSREAHWQGAIPVGTLSRDESNQLFLKLTRQPVTAVTSQIAEVLGDLALAVRQAAMYMWESQTSYEIYLRLYENKRKLLRYNEEAPPGYTKPVQVTLEISRAKIKEILPGALKHLSLAAYVGRNQIPRFLFTDRVNDTETKRELHTLQAYSFFSVETVGKETTYSVHPLVQEVSRDAQTEIEKSDQLKTLQTRFKKEWNLDVENPETWEKANLLADHLRLYSSYAAKDPEMIKKDSDAAFETCLNFNYLGAFYLYLQTDLTRAKRYLNEGLQISREALGFGHPSILNTLGQILTEQGELSAATECYVESLAALRQTLGESSPELASVLSNYAQLEIKRGNLDRAFPLLMEALKRLEMVYPGGHPSIGGCLSYIANTYLLQGKLDLAISHYRKAEKIFEKKFTRNHYNVSAMLLNLAEIYLLQGSLHDALECANEALEINKRLYGKNHPQVGKAIWSIGKIHEKKDHQKALPFFNEALAIFEKAFKADENLAKVYFDIGSNDLARGDYSSAEKRFRQAEEIISKIFGADHVMMAQPLTGLGAIHLGQKRVPQAIECFTKALKIYEDNANRFGHDQMAGVLLYLAIASENLGNLDLAIQYGKRAIEVHEKIAGPNNIAGAHFHTKLGVLYQKKGNLFLAGDHLLKALNAQKLNFGKDHPEIRPTIQNLEGIAGLLLEKTVVLNRQDQHVQASQHLLRAIELQKAATGDKHRLVLAMLDNLNDLTNLMIDAGNMYRARNDRRAIDYFTQVIPAFQMLHGSAGTARVQLTLAAICYDQGDPAAAFKNYLEAIAILKGALGPEHNEIAKHLGDLAIIYMKEKQWTLAIECFHEALTILKKAYGNRAPKDVQAFVNGVHSSLGSIYIFLKEFDLAVSHYTLAQNQQGIDRAKAKKLEQQSK